MAWSLNQNRVHDIIIYGVGLRGISSSSRVSDRDAMRIRGLVMTRLLGSVGINLQQLVGWKCIHVDQIMAQTRFVAENPHGSPAAGTSGFNDMPSKRSWLEVSRGNVLQ